MSPLIDLRSDTLTQPTLAMRRAIAQAIVGDEQKGEDPTVIALEESVAKLLGHEEAVLVPSATMANQIALRLLSEPGDEVLAAANSHIFRYELGGPAVHSGLVMQSIETRDGLFSAAELRAAVAPSGRFPPAGRVLSLENTHAEGGGRVWPIERLREVVAEARSLGLRLHLDGARLMNAARAGNVPAADYANCFDTVALCLTKGLGCPVGALIAGSHEHMRKARRLKQLFGGAMRQAGILAAAGLHALEHHVERLTEDHSNAKRLATGLALAGLPVDPNQVESNVVLVRVGRLGLTADEALRRLGATGVLLSGSAQHKTLRALTYLGITTADIDRAIPAAVAALTSS